MSSSTVNNAAEILSLVASELTYLPTPEQRKVKAAFWARFNENPSCEPEDISAILVESVTGDTRPTKWWSQAGFKEWFRNRDEFRQRMEYLSHLALDRLEAILADPRAQNNAQVGAAKLIMEVARKMPSRNPQEQFLDEKIHQMDRKQLEEYIKRSLKLLPQATNSLDKPTETK